MMMIYVLVIFFLIFRWWHRSGSWRSSRIYRKILLHLAVLVLLSFSPIWKFSFFCLCFLFCLICHLIFVDFVWSTRIGWWSFELFYFYFCVWNLLIWEFDADFLKILCVCMFNNCLFLWIWFLGLWFSYFSLTWIFVVIFIFIFLFLFS